MFVAMQWLWREEGEKSECICEIVEEYFIDYLSKSMSPICFRTCFFYCFHFRLVHFVNCSGALSILIPFFLQFIFHAGPTNSGKTYHALQRYRTARTGTNVCVCVGEDGEAAHGGE